MFNKPATQNFLSPKIILALSFIVAAYWITGNFINIYSNDFVGAIFEILWLPMLLLLFVLPALSIFFWVKSHFKLNSLYLFSFAMVAAALVIIIAKNN